MRSGTLAALFPSGLKHAKCAGAASAMKFFQAIAEIASRV
jgi:hypothetical protein